MLSRTQIRGGFTSVLAKCCSSIRLDSIQVGSIGSIRFQHGSGLFGFWVLALILDSCRAACWSLLTFTSIAAKQRRIV